MELKDQGGRVWPAGVQPAERREVTDFVGRLGRGRIKFPAHAGKQPVNSLPSKGDLARPQKTTEDPENFEWEIVPVTVA